MRASARLVVVFATALLVLAAAGCGGGDESSDTSQVDAWAADFCTAVTTWTDELEQIGNTVDDPTSLSADSIRQAADDLDAATAEFIDDVQALGRPETMSGQEVEDSLNTLTDTLDTERGDIRETLDNVSSITDIPEAISAIGSSLTAMGDAFGDTLQALEDADVDGELETALENADECDEISE